MKTLIFSDIHLKHKRVQTVIDRYEKESVDEIICLGDYFDDFHDTPERNAETALWLKDFLARPKCLGILGNHELNYMYDKRIYVCSGFTQDKSDAINTVFDTSDWDKLKVIHETQGYVLTHAGISREVGDHPVKGWDYETFKSKCEKALDRLKIGNVGPLFRAGQARGGFEPVGGINWCDFNYEFTPIPGVKQIFGHTPGNEVRWSHLGDCALDTHLKHFAVIEDGELKIEKIL